VKGENKLGFSVIGISATQISEIFPVAFHTHAKGKVLPDDNKKDGEVSRPPQL